jgi:hypothetical protein
MLKAENENLKKDSKGDLELCSLINYDPKEKNLVLLFFNLEREKPRDSESLRKSLILLLALTVIPIFWVSYSLNGWVIMMGVSFIGLCLMRVYEVDHRNIRLFCNTLVKVLKVLKEK